MVLFLSTNDNGLIYVSGLNDYLNEILDVLPGIGIFLSLYGDASMQLTQVIQNYFRNPNEREEVWNRRVPSAHMSIKVDYGLIFNILWVMIQDEKKHLYMNGEHFFVLVQFVFFLKNCWVCLKGSAVNSLFDIKPPTIKKYLDVDEVLEPH